MTRKSISMMAMIVTGLLLVSILPLGVKAAPVIEQMKHFPRFPVFTDRVNMSAKITSAVSLQTVQVLYCFYYPPPLGGICQFHDLLGPDANQVYNWTVDLDQTSISMDYYFRALDTNSDLTETAPIFVQYAFNMTASMTSDNANPYPGQNLNLTVSAYYSDNTSAPVEFSSVTIVRQFSAEQWVGTTDVNGDCTIEITAPGAVYSYTYAATVTNRSLSDTAEVDIVVLVEPMPDIVVETEDMVISNMHPLEGENITANITVENWGSLGATFHVLVTLYAGGSTRTLANVGLTIGPSSQTYIHVAWDAVLGLQYLNVTADPGNFVREASEANNFASAFLTGEKPIVDETPIILYISIILIVVIALIAVVLLMRRKKPSAPQQ